MISTPIKQWLLFIIMIVGRACPALSQTNHVGRDFYLTVGGTPYYIYTNNLAIALSSKHQATVTFTYTASGTIQTYIVAANSVKEVKLVASAMDLISATQSEIVENQSLHITADSPITVSIVDISDHASDATIVYPTDGQPAANEFYLNTPYADVSNTSIGLVSLCDSVVVEITLTDTAFVHGPTSPFTVVLNAGQTFQIESSPQDFVDYAGSHIRVLDAKCCNPLNVFCETDLLHTYYPADLNNYFCCGDNMMEQISPVNQWANSLPALPFAPQQTSLVRVLAAQDNTPVFFDNALVAQIDAGSTFDTLITAPTYIHSPNRVHVSQFMLSVDCDANGLGDPEMLQLVSIDQGTRESWFRFHQLSPYNNLIYLLTVIAPSAQTSGMLLDGSPVIGFTPFPNSPQFSYATVAIPDTSIAHHFTAPQKVIAYVIKSSPQDTYIQTLADLNELLPPGGVDTIVICAGTPVLLQASLGAGIYTWSTGDTTAIITTAAAGLITVVGNTGFSGCTGTAINTDSFYLVRIPQDTVRLAYASPDSFFACAQVPVILAAPADADSYAWSTGAQSQSISVGEAGAYLLTSASQEGCTYTLRTDTFRVYDAQPDTFITTTAYPTIYLCSGSATTLQASVTGSSTHWSTGADGPTISVADTGVYSAWSITTQGCDFILNTDSFTVAFATANPVAFSLGNDTTICLGKTLQLLTPFANTIWSDNITGPSITVTSPGVYSASVADTCGVIFSDSIRVAFVRCDTLVCRMVFPNSFSPNGDQLNESFGPLAHGPITSYELMIANRWGQQLFSTADILRHWDGNYNGAAQGVETYYFLCRYRCQGGGEQMIKGGFTLLR